jgi:RNA polymerase sigma-70 factor, ECF subfamily
LTGFAEIVRTHQAMVFSIAYHALHDRGQAEELAQDVFLQLHRHLGSIESPEHLVYWLRRTTCHRAIDAMRRRQRSPERAFEVMPEPADGAAQADPMRDAALRKMVAALPEQQRLVVVLRYQEDMDPAEIAKILEMPVNTVKSYLQRGLAMLREKLVRGGLHELA